MVKDPEVTITVEKLLTNDMGILKKIKDNLPTKDDERHSDVASNTLKIIEDKSNFEGPLTLACKCLFDYVKDGDLYDKHLSDKIDDVQMEESEGYIAKERKSWEQGWGEGLTTKRTDMRYAKEKWKYIFRKV